MQEIAVSILSPYKNYSYEKVKSVNIESNNDSFEIFAGHSEICSNLDHGKIYLNLDKEQLIFNFFKASLNFQNEFEKLNLFCLDFNHEKDVVISFQDFEAKLLTETQTTFHLELSKDNSIYLEKRLDE